MAVEFITSTQIVDHLITILQASQDVTDYLEDNELGELMIFDNPTSIKPPGENDVPFISIYRYKTMKGEKQNEWQYIFELEVGVVDDTNTEENGVTYQNGVRLVEGFGYVVYNAIRQGLSCNLQLDEADIMVDETAHPLYLAYYGFKITLHRVIGVDIQL